MTWRVTEKVLVWMATNCISMCFNVWILSWQMLCQMLTAWGPKVKSGLYLCLFVCRFAGSVDCQRSASPCRRSGLAHNLLIDSKSQLSGPLSCMLCMLFEGSAHFSIIPPTAKAQGSSMSFLYETYINGQTKSKSAGRPLFEHNPHKTKRMFTNL